MAAAILPRSFCARDALVVARDLLGMELHCRGQVLRITEVEAYRWPGDSACHARHGKTPRNAALWGPPGQVYVYLCYGIHNMLNIVTGVDGEASAVLIRGCEPDLDGPGKVGQSLGLDVSWSGHRLYRRGGLELRKGRAVAHALVGPRIGIDYADPEHRALPWRLADPASPAVSHRGRFA